MAPQALTPTGPLPPWAAEFQACIAVTAPVALVECDGRTHRGRAVGLQWDGRARSWVAILTFAPPGCPITGSTLFGVDAARVVRVFPSSETRENPRETREKPEGRR